MAELKKMPWNEPVWNALRAAMSPIPPFVRKRALLKIIQASEENAMQRASNRVEAEDLIKAAKEKVPESVRKICFESLAEHGITENL